MNSPLHVRIDKATQDQILELLNGFGEHFAEWFGRDLRIRLGGVGGVTAFVAYATNKEDGESVSELVCACTDTILTHAHAFSIWVDSTFILLSAFAECH